MDNDPIAIAKRGIDVFDHGDWEAFGQDLTEDGVYWQAATGEEVHGVEDNLRIAKAWHEAFPDVNGEITNAFTNGDQVCLQILWTGTHTGPLVGPAGTIPPTGRRATLPACQIVTVKDGKIARTDHYFDLMTLLAQLGVLDVPEMQEVP